MPKPLDTGRLAKFEPRPRSVEPEAPSGAGEADTVTAPAEKPKATKNAKPSQAPEPAQRRWRSREPVMDGQISIKAGLDVLERFKAMCADDRRTYGAMLEILMDSFESKPK